MKKKDPSGIQEPDMATKEEVAFRIALEKYFEKVNGVTTYEKLHDFAKYVPRQSLSKFLSRYELFKKVQHIEGSIVECGVYLGGGLMSFAKLSAIFEPVNYQRQIIGFDTFEGFTALSSKDKVKDVRGASVHAKKGGYARDVVADLLECIELYDANRFLNHVPKVSLVKGDIKKTVPQYLKDNPHTVVSLLYLDVDVYEPTRVALEHFVPRMGKGAVIAFDELNAPRWPGETRAVLETLGIRNLRIERFPQDTMLSYAVLE